METETNIYTALAKAQSGFQPIRREKTVNVRMKNGGTYTFSYAPLETILRAVQPALSKEGLALTQNIMLFEGIEYVETALSFGSQSIYSRVKIIVVESGPQAYGSALMYARRYGITLLLCLCADDDDDANAAEGNEATVQKPEIKEVPELVPQGAHKGKHWNQLTDNYLHWAIDNLPETAVLHQGCRAEISRRLDLLTAGIGDDIPHESVSES